MGDKWMKGYMYIILIKLKYLLYIKPKQTTYFLNENNYGRNKRT